MTSMIRLNQRPRALACRDPSAWSSARRKSARCIDQRILEVQPSSSLSKRRLYDNSKWDSRLKQTTHFTVMFEQEPKLLPAHLVEHVHDTLVVLGLPVEQAECVFLRGRRASRRRSRSHARTTADAGFERAIRVLLNVGSSGAAPVSLEIAAGSMRPGGAVHHQVLMTEARRTPRRS